MSQAPGAASTTPAAEQPPSPSSLERPGYQVVLGLFLILAVCVVIIFTLFGLMVRPEDREWVPTLTFRYLYMPVVATSLLVSIDAYRAKWHAPYGWLLFFFTAPVPIVNIVLAAVWLLKWRPAATASA